MTDNMPESDELVFFGDEVKALDDSGRVGGYLILYSTKDDPDLSGDFFTKDTDFGPASQSVSWFHHRQSAKLEDGTVVPALKKRLGDVKLVKNEFGIWAEGILNLRDQYEKFIHEQVVAGKIGFSSGTSPHTVDREIVGKGVAWIKSWPLGTDASYTPAPCEFRNKVVNIKSLSFTPQAADASGPPIKEQNKMEQTEEIKAAVQAALDSERAAAKAEAERAEEIKKAKDEGYQAAIAEVKAAGPAFNKITERGFSEEKDAVPAFKHWVKTGKPNGGLIVPGSSFNNIPDGVDGTKAAFNVTDAATGGYLVPDPLYNQIIAKRNLASWVRKMPVQRFTTASDHIQVPVEDTSHHAFTQTGEGVAYHEDEGTLAEVDLKLYKYTKEVKMSEEFIKFQATNFDSWLVDALGRAEAVTENTIYTTNTGTTMPLGIAATGGSTSANSMATSDVIAPSEITELIGYLGAGYNIPAECGFLLPNKTKWYLLGLTGSPFQFLNTPQGSIDSLFGYQNAIDDDLDAYTVHSGKVMVFGNFSYYGIVENPGLIVQRNPYLYMANGYVALFASMFRGGATLQSEAFYYLTGHPD